MKHKDIYHKGMNAFLSSAPSPKRLWRIGDKGSHPILPKEVIRATDKEKEAQIRTVENPGTRPGQAPQQAYAEEGNAALRKLQAASPDPIGEAAIRNVNMFAVLMEATKFRSLVELTVAVFEVGGQYRSNM